MFRRDIGFLVARNNYCNRSDAVAVPATVRIATVIIIYYEKAQRASTPIVQDSVVKQCMTLYSITRISIMYRLTTDRPSRVAVELRPKRRP